MARQDAFDSGRGATPAAPTSSGPVPEAEWGTRPAPQHRAPAPKREAVAAQVAAQVAGRNRSDEEGIRTRSVAEMQAMSATARQGVAHTAVPTESRGNRALIMTGREHHSILQGKVHALSAAHGDHPVAGRVLEEVQGHLNAAAAQLHHAGGITDAANKRENSREGTEQAKPHITSGLDSLLKAHDVLTGNAELRHIVGDDKEGNSNAHPGVSRAGLETAHGIAKRQGGEGNFRPSNPVKIQDIGGAKVDRSTKEGKAVARTIRDAGRAGVAGVDVNVASRVARKPQTPTRFRKSEQANRVAAGETATDTSVPDAKVPVRTSEADVNVRSANLASEGTLEGTSDFEAPRAPTIVGGRGARLQPQTEEQASAAVGRRAEKAAAPKAPPAPKLVGPNVGVNDARPMPWADEVRPTGRKAKPAAAPKKSDKEIAAGSSAITSALAKINKRGRK